MADELNLDQGWSLTESAFGTICEVLSRKPPGCIVEFGSGVSSIRLAQRFPDAAFLSVEHDSEQLAKTERLAERHLARTNVSFSLRPLTWQLQLGAWFRSYRPGAFPSRVDAVIVDGPPSYCFRGREACLHQIAGSLGVGAVVILDDYAREAERRANMNWERAYPGQFLTREIQVGHGLCIKERVSVQRARRRPHVMLENYVALGLHITRWVLRSDVYPPFPQSP